MKTALFISPHLDDVAFSCGGTLIEFGRKGWQTILCTVFTQTVLNPDGFALRCQTDKGLSPTIDYMALRRDEDHEFAQIADVSKTLHLIFPEAPHRGYNSAPELFAGIKDGDQVWQAIANELGAIVEEYKPSLIFAPQGIGNHTDHLHTIKAILASSFLAQILWYRDTPYVIRNENAAPSDLLPQNLNEYAVEISDSLEAKIIGCCAYQTQIGFQFNGAEQLGVSLRNFHQREAERKQTGRFAECFLTNEQNLEI